MCGYRQGSHRYGRHALPSPPTRYVTFVTLSVLFALRPRFVCYFCPSPSFICFGDLIITSIIYLPRLCLTDRQASAMDAACLTRASCGTRVLCASSACASTSARRTSGGKYIPSTDCKFNFYRLCTDRRSTCANRCSRKIVPRCPLCLLLSYRIILAPFDS